MTRAPSVYHKERRKVGGGEVVSCDVAQDDLGVAKFAIIQAYCVVGLGVTCICLANSQLPPQPPLKLMTKPLGGLSES